MKHKESPYMLTVPQAAPLLGLGDECIRRGIIEGTLPGTVIRGTQDRAKFIIPKRALEIYLSTGITPMMLAQSVCRAETIEQGIAIIRAVFQEEQI